MEKNSRIFVAGHRGLVGSAIWKSLEDRGYSNLIGRTHRELDLEDPAAVREFFDREKPEYVFLAAAFVGGIIANSRYRADFIFRNLPLLETCQQPDGSIRIPEALVPYFGADSIRPEQG